MLRIAPANPIDVCAYASSAIARSSDNERAAFFAVGVTGMYQEPFFISSFSWLRCVDTSRTRDLNGVSINSSTCSSHFKRANDRSCAVYATC